MLAVVSENKDLCVIIIKRADYIAKMQTVIYDGIACGVYTPTPSKFSVTSYTVTLRIIQNMKMLPRSNQPARLYGTAKMHKFASPDLITSSFEQLLEFFNNYHPNIKLTYEINPEKFLDTKICYNNSQLPPKWTEGLQN